MSFDIKFTRLGFENACWIARQASRCQHAFSKPCLVNLISKDTHLVFSMYDASYSINSLSFDMHINWHSELFISSTGLRVCLHAKYLLPCSCINHSLLFDMQHDHILKTLNLASVPHPKSCHPDPGHLTKISLDLFHIYRTSAFMNNLGEIYWQLTKLFGN